MAHVCGDLIKMPGRNSLDSLFHTFPYWVTIGGWSCVEGQGSVCAAVSKITCHHFVGGQRENRCHTQCVFLQDKYRQRAKTNTDGLCREILSTKAPGWTAYGWQLTAGRLYTFHHWSRGRGGDSWSEPLWYNIHCNTRAFFRTLYMCLSCTIFVVLFLYVGD